MKTRAGKKVLLAAGLCAAIFCCPLAAAKEKASSKAASEVKAKKSACSTEKRAHLEELRQKIQQLWDKMEKFRLEAENMESQINQLKAEFSGEALTKNIAPLQEKLQKAKESKEQLEPDYNAMSEEITSLKTDCGIP